MFSAQVDLHVSPLVLFGINRNLRVLENFIISPNNGISLNLAERNRDLPCGRASLMSALHRFFQNTTKKLKTETGKASRIMQSDDKRLVWSNVLKSDDI
jgi:hypothetical protein